MEWYWWLLIAVGVIVLVVLKLTVLKHWQKNSKMKKEQKERELEDD